MLILSRKVRLKLTSDQAVLARKSAGTARWAYNKYLAISRLMYDARQIVGGPYYTSGDFRKEITQLKKTTEYSWLREVAANVVKQAVKNCDSALKRYFKNVSGYPRFKKKGQHDSFYVNYESFHKINGGCYIEKLGFVRTSESLPDNVTFLDGVTVSYDGKYWYVSFTYQIQEKNSELTDESLGIDLGIKNLAVLSNGKVYGNINKTKRVKSIEKRLRRQQRKLSRKRESNKSRTLRDCRNYQKQSKKVRLLYRRLANMRNDYLHKTTTEIVKTKPSRIVLEDLHVQNLMRNRHLAKAIQEQKWYEFRRQIEYKSQIYGITVVIVSRWFPSSKQCHVCGYINKELVLKDREWTCPECSTHHDRDLNAAINLANYST